MTPDQLLTVAVMVGGLVLWGGLAYLTGRADEREHQQSSEGRVIVHLTDEQYDRLRMLARGWGVSDEEALRTVLLLAAQMGPAAHGPDMRS